MRSPLNNPFHPGSDVVPEVWAGRIDQLTDWRDRVRPRLVSGQFERGRTILGEPGLGKSSLVRRIAADERARGGWATQQIRIPSGTDPMRAVSRAMLALAEDAGLAASTERRIADLIARIRQISVGGAGVGIDGAPAAGDPHTALTDLLVDIGRAAMRQGVVVLLHIDEVQNITDGEALSQLLVALGDAMTWEEHVAAPGGVVVARSLPIAVYLTGLPDFEDHAGAQKGATFARRFQTVTLGGIDDDDLRAALAPFILPGWPVAQGDGEAGQATMHPDAVSEIVRVSRGEPFLFQLAGQFAWDAGTGSQVTLDEVQRGWRSAAPEARAHVERIIDRLPRREQDFLTAMAAMPTAERTATGIAKTLGYTTAAEVGTTAGRLDRVRGVIKRGKPYSFQHRAIEAFLTTSWPELEDGEAGRE